MSASKEARKGHSTGALLAAGICSLDGMGTLSSIRTYRVPPTVRAVCSLQYAVRFPADIAGKSLSR